MNIQETIDQTNLDMTLAQVKAFFLGILCAEKPLPFPKALAELLEETPEAKTELEAPLKEVWDGLQKNTRPNLRSSFRKKKTSWSSLKWPKISWIIF